VILTGRACEAVGRLAELTHSTAALRPLEIGAAGVTKESARKQLCATLGTAKEEVVAFDHMPNDLPMLTWADHSVGVANAHPDVVRAAGELPASNDERGVARCWRGSSPWFTASSANTTDQVNMLTRSRPIAHPSLRGDGCGARGRAAFGAHRRPTSAASDRT
jgi:hypothetical protein